ncbi:unnamed protein product [Staurois parvus]|uniref:Uncharacterized protein n=1 Tax=Staurois parvus TaxID=386267 RepID=A0ABN9AH65_9NEOB|nr:unnamed protein product [Staurois parvus]
MAVRSCDQRCTITADHMGHYPDHQSTDDQCALMICLSVHQCQLSVLTHATCQWLSVPHQCHISVPI